MDSSEIKRNAPRSAGMPCQPEEMNAMNVNADSNLMGQADSVAHQFWQRIKLCNHPNSRFSTRHLLTTSSPPTAIACIHHLVVFKPLRILLLHHSLAYHLATPSGISLYLGDTPGFLHLARVYQEEYPNDLSLTQVNADLVGLFLLFACWLFPDRLLTLFVLPFIKVLTRIQYAHNDIQFG